MSISMITTDGMIRTMCNAFPEATNKKVHWGASTSQDTVKISCTYHDEPLSYTTNLREKVNAVTGRRMTPSAATANAIVHFQEVFKDMDKKQADIAEAKEAYKAEVQEAAKAEVEAEVKSVDTLTVDEIDVIKARIEAGEKVTDIAKELGFQWQSLKAKIK